MKKLILMGAVAIFSLGASAQKFDASKSILLKPAKAECNVKINANALETFKSVEKKPASRAPEGVTGTPRDYFLVTYCQVENLGMFQKAVKQTVYFDEAKGTVYLPLMMYDTTSGLAEDGGVYIPCTFTQHVENGTEVAGVKDIIVPNNAVVGIGQTTTGQSTNLVICNLNPSSQVGDPLTTNGVLYYDEAADVIFSVDMDPNNPLMFGLYDATDDNGNQVIDNEDTHVLRSMCGMGFNYYPVNDVFFKSPVTREVTYDTQENGKQSKTVVEYQMNYVDEASGTYMLTHFVNGLFNDYANSWAIMMPVDLTTDDYGMVAQYSTEVNLLCYGTPTADGGSVDTQKYSTFYYDTLTDGYQQKSGEYMFSLAYDATNKMPVITEGYYNMILGAGTVGINNVTTSTDKEAVATEYYDLSGRRVSAAEKGVTIKVEKYADGTSKATKVMK